MTYAGRHAAESQFGAGEPDGDIRATIKEILHGELSHFLSDIEWRVKQAYEVAARSTGNTLGQVFAEDINTLRHQVTGYTVTANSPAAGSIAWASLHIVYAGVDYTIADGNTANKYVWFIKPASGTTATLSTGNTKPTLSAADALIFVNNAGVPTSVLESSVAPVVGDGAIGTSELANGAVTAAKTDFYADLAAAVTAAQDAADLAQATADGAIVTYFQSAAPWANGDATAGGASNPAAKTGDVWYDSDDGQAYRWSGPGGSPVNQWVPISDSDIGAALTAANNAQTTANSKVTTFYAASTATPTAVAVGDLWVVTDQGNLLKRASATGTASWVTVGAGTSASNITTGTLAGTLVGTGVSASNVTTGTLAGSLVGTGINGSNVTTGTIGGARVGSGISASNVTTGTLPAAQIGTGTVAASKLNTLQHVLF